MYIFIVNPIAGYGKARRIFSKIVKSNLYKQIKSNYHFTTHKGHAEELTQKIIKGENINVITGIIVIGGDGTFHEVVNGLGDVKLPLSFIPGGSGNDFARGSSIQGKPLKIFERIINQKLTIPYWLGNYCNEYHKHRYFVNSIGFGFDAEIVKAANASRSKRLVNRLNLGNLIYVLALIKVLFYFAPFTLEIETDGKKQTYHQCWMGTITNHPFYGGGMKILPDATIQPDYFSILVIHNISKWKILSLFLTVFWGKHINFREVTVFKAKNIRISSKEGLLYQVDGQIGECQTSIISKEKQPIQILGSKF